MIVQLEFDLNLKPLNLFLLFISVGLLHTDMLLFHWWLPLSQPQDYGNAKFFMEFLIMSNYEINVHIKAYNYLSVRQQMGELLMKSWQIHLTACSYIKPLLFNKKY